MELKIEQVKLNYAKPLARRVGKDVKYLVVHHTDGPTVQSVQSIHEWHKSRGWAGIGYHYLVYESGRIVKCRPSLRVPACVAGHNRESLCVAFVGSFMNRPPSKDHLQLGARLCAYLRHRWKVSYGVTIELKRHSDLNEVFCPGEAFPWAEFLRRVDEWLRSLGRVLYF